MVALYRENILMFVNFAKKILKYINTKCTFKKKILDTPSYNCIYIYCQQNQVCRPVKIVHKNVFLKIW